MHILVIDNPRSGQGDAGMYDYVRELVHAGADVTVRPMGAHADLAPLLADAASFDRLVAGGGDGTASAIAYEVRGSGIPILAYPGGTANLLAANLGLPYEPKELARATLGGATLQTDLGELDAAGRRTGFAIMAGAGFDAAVMEGAAQLKSTLGVGAYFLSVLRNLAPVVATFRLTIDGTGVDTDGIAVVLVNFAKIQFDLSVTHDSDATDGLLEVAVIRARSAVELIPAVWAALLDRVVDHPDRSSGLETYRGREIRLESDPPLPLQFDGEVSDATTPLSARVLPRAATFVVPG